MRAIVLYSSISGNTEKVAKEIADELKCQSVKLEENSSPSTIDLNRYDIVFLGTGNYTGKPHAILSEYLKRLNLTNKLKFALFITWIGREPSDKYVFDEVKILVESKNQVMLNNFFECFGQASPSVPRWIYNLLGHGSLGHPNAEELDQARKWAKEQSNI